jgi:circadian clock protein KaiC
VVKLRGSEFDPTLREFVITNGRGLSLTGAFEGAADLLTGFARERSTQGLRASDPEGQ